jgi:hypothetical protein
MVEKDPKWYSLWQLREPEWLEGPEKLEEPEKFEEMYEPKWSSWHYSSNRRDYNNAIKEIQGQLTILSNLFWELKQKVEKLMKDMENNK